MSQINLLPWRLEYRKIRNRVFYSVLMICVCIMCLIMFGVHEMLSIYQARERVNIHYLQSETRKTLALLAEVASLKSQKEKLIKGMEVIRTLHHERFSLVYLLDTIVRITPAGLWLTELKRSENQICLEGVADTNASISELLRNLEQQNQFANIKLSEVKYHKKKIGLFFKVELENIELALEEGGYS